MYVDTLMYTGIQCMCVYIYVDTHTLYVDTHTLMYTRIYCMCVYIYVDTHTLMYTRIH